MNTLHLYDPGYFWLPLFSQWYTFIFQPRLWIESFLRLLYIVLVSQFVLIITPTLRTVWFWDFLVIYLSGIPLFLLASCVFISMIVKTRMISFVWICCHNLIIVMLYRSLLSCAIILLLLSTFVMGINIERGFKFDWPLVVGHVLTSVSISSQLAFLPDIWTAYFMLCIVGFTKSLSSCFGHKVFGAVFLTLCVVSKACNRP